MWQRGVAKSTAYHDLVPLSVYVRLSELCVAVVSIPPGSLPWFGSVRPKQPIRSPLAKGEREGVMKEGEGHTGIPKGGKYFSLCSSVPY